MPVTYTVRIFQPVCTVKKDTGGPILRAFITQTSPSTTKSPHHWTLEVKIQFLGYLGYTGSTLKLSNMSVFQYYVSQKISARGRWQCTKSMLLRN